MRHINRIRWKTQDKVRKGVKQILETFAQAAWKVTCALYNGKKCPGFENDSRKDTKGHLGFICEWSDYRVSLATWFRQAVELWSSDRVCNWRGRQNIIQVEPSCSPTQIDIRELTIWLQFLQFPFNMQNISFCVVSCGASRNKLHANPPGTLGALKYITETFVMLLFC